MTATQEDVRKRLLYILHLGLVEIRNLALAANQPQIAELADALETLPRCANGCSEDDLGLARFVLEKYQAAYQSNFDYPARLDRYQPPDHF